MGVAAFLQTLYTVSFKSCGEQVLFIVMLHERTVCRTIVLYVEMMTSLPLILGSVKSAHVSWIHGFLLCLKETSKRNKEAAIGARFMLGSCAYALASIIGLGSSMQIRNADTLAFLMGVLV